MLYSCSHMATVGVKGLIHFCSLDTNTFRTLEVVRQCHSMLSLRTCFTYLEPLLGVSAATCAVSVWVGGGQVLGR